MIEYPTALNFVDTTKNEYGDETAGQEFEVACVLDQATGYRHSNNQDVQTADSIAFVDPDDEFLQDRGFRVEQMKCFATVYNDQKQWYRVTSVILSRRTQLDNELDNVQLTLKKTMEPKS